MRKILFGFFLFLLFAGAVQAAVQVVASNNIQVSDNVTHSLDPLSNSSWIIMSYLPVVSTNITGTFRVTFDCVILNNGGGGTGNCRLYKNGQVFGANKAIAFGGWQSFSEDITGLINTTDTLDLRIQANGGDVDGGQVRNFQLKYDPDMSGNIILNGVAGGSGWQNYTLDSGMRIRKADGAISLKYNVSDYVSLWEPWFHTHTATLYDDTGTNNGTCYGQTAWHGIYTDGVSNYCKFNNFSDSTNFTVLLTQSKGASTNTYRAGFATDNYNAATRYDLLLFSTWDVAGTTYTDINLAGTTKSTTISTSVSTDNKWVWNRSGDTIKFSKNYSVISTQTGLGTGIFHFYNPTIGADWQNGAPVSFGEATTYLLAYFNRSLTQQEQNEVFNGTTVKNGNLTIIQDSGIAGKKYNGIAAYVSTGATSNYSLKYKNSSDSSFIYLGTNLSGNSSFTISNYSNITIGVECYSDGNSVCDVYQIILKTPYIPLSTYFTGFGTNLSNKSSFNVSVLADNSHEYIYFRFKTDSNNYYEIPYYLNNSQLNNITLSFSSAKIIGSPNWSNIINVTADSVANAYQDAVNATNFILNNKTSIPYVERFHIDYYGWQKNPTDDGIWNAWNNNGHSPPLDIVSNYYPLDNLYSNMNTTDVNRHLKYINASGVQILTFDLFGDTFRPQLATLMNATNEYNTKVILFLDWDAKDPQNVVREIKFWVDNYGNNPKLYRDSEYGNRPVIYTYQSSGGGSITGDMWYQNLSTIRGTQYDAVVIGQEFASDSFLMDLENSSGLDGMFRYDPGTRDYNSKNYSNYSKFNKKMYSKDIATGFNNTRNGGGCLNVSGQCDDRNNGTTYLNMFNNATIRDANERFNIISYNEWLESTTIEPVNPDMSSNETPSFKYLNYAPHPPTYYIDKTAQMIWNYSGLGDRPLLDYYGNSKTNNYSIRFNLSKSDNGTTIFNVTSNRTADIRWYVDDVLQQTNASHPADTPANFTPFFAIGGLHKVQTNASNTNGTTATMYWEVTVADITPPASITNNSTSTGNFYINNTWTKPSDVDFNYTMFRNLTGELLTNLSNTSWNRTLTPHYTQNISAQTVDTSGNVNTTLVWFNATTPNSPLLGKGSIVISDIDYDGIVLPVGSANDFSTNYNAVGDYSTNQVIFGVTKFNLTSRYDDIQSVKNNITSVKVWYYTQGNFNNPNFTLYLNYSQNDTWDNTLKNWLTGSYNWTDALPTQMIVTPNNWMYFDITSQFRNETNKFSTVTLHTDVSNNNGVTDQYLINNTRSAANKPIIVINYDTTNYGNYSHYNEKKDIDSFYNGYSLLEQWNPIIVGTTSGDTFVIFDSGGFGGIVTSTTKYASNLVPNFTSLTFNTNTSSDGGIVATTWDNTTYKDMNIHIGTNTVYYNFKTPSGKKYYRSTPNAGNISIFANATGIPMWYNNATPLIIGSSVSSYARNDYYDSINGFLVYGGTTYIINKTYYYSDENQFQNVGTDTIQGVQRHSWFGVNSPTANIDLAYRQSNADIIRMGIMTWKSSNEVISFSNQSIANLVTVKNRTVTAGNSGLRVFPFNETIYANSSQGYLILNTSLYLVIDETRQVYNISGVFYFNNGTTRTIEPALGMSEQKMTRTWDYVDFVNNGWLTDERLELINNDTRTTNGIPNTLQIMLNFSVKGNNSNNVSVGIYNTTKLFNSSDIKVTNNLTGLYNNLSINGNNSYIIKSINVSLNSSASINVSVNVYNTTTFNLTATNSTPVQTMNLTVYNDTFQINNGVSYKILKDGSVQQTSIAANNSVLFNLISVGSEYTITANDQNSGYVPPIPTPNSTSVGNFYVNFTWNTGVGNVTNSYNVSTNGVWSNGSLNTYHNSSLSAHSWHNISVWAFNTSAGNISTTSLNNNTQIPNNNPVMNSIGNKNVNEGTWLNFTVSGSDLDSDSLSCATTASKGSLTGCNFNWSITYSDSGTYIWTYYLNDTYGGSSYETITVTVNDVGQYYVPPVPITNSISTSNFYINFTWQSGSGNITNGYNVSVNGAWSNTSNTYHNSTLSAHAWHNITVWAFNSTGNNLSTTSLTNNTQIPNNNLTQTIIGSKTVNEGQWLNFTVSSTDIDLDTITYGTNATNGTFNTVNGNFNWSTNYSSAGIYYWYYNSSDGYGSTGNETVMVTVNDVGQYYPPPVPTTNSVSTGNFYVNFTWNAGTGNVTDGYNVTVNGAWANTTNPYHNSTLTAHTWHNITIWGFNSTGNNLSSSSLSNNTQIPNNALTQSPIGAKTADENTWLNFTVSSTDPDSDTITYGTNATSGTFNISTGNFNWSTNYSSAGTYYWYFNSSDGYGSIGNETVTITINDIIIGTNTTPTISNIQNGTVAATYAIINYTVNQSNALSHIEYSFNINLSSSTNTSNLTTGTSRSTNITGLSNNTLYYYRIIAYNNTNTTYFSQSSIYNFTTPSNITLQINEYTPLSNPSTINGTSQSFTITTNKMSTITWYQNSTLKQTNSSSNTATFVNDTLASIIGVHNITVYATNGSEIVSQTWNWTVSSTTTWSISGYTFDNNGNPLSSVTAQNGSLSSISNTQGYYNISGFDNGTWNVTFSKSGFNSNYSNVNISYGHNTTINITLWDTTPPGQVIGLTNGTISNSTINISWNSVATASWYEVFRNLSHLSYTQNTYYNDTSLLDNITYNYSVRANDTYNNWGTNSSILNVTTGSNQTIQPIPTPHPTAPPSGSVPSGTQKGTIVYINDFPTPTPSTTPTFQSQETLLIIPLYGKDARIETPNTENPVKALNLYFKTPYRGEYKITFGKYPLYSPPLENARLYFSITSNLEIKDSSSIDINSPTPIDVYQLINNKWQKTQTQNIATGIYRVKISSFGTFAIKDAPPSPNPTAQIKKVPLTLKEKIMQKDNEMYQFINNTLQNIMIQKAVPSPTPAPQIKNPPSTLEYKITQKDNEIYNNISSIDLRSQFVSLNKVIMQKDNEIYSKIVSWLNKSLS